MVLNFGEVIAAGDPADVARDPVVMDAYLGADDGGAAGPGDVAAGDAGPGDVVAGDADPGDMAARGAGRDDG